MGFAVKDAQVQRQHREDKNEKPGIKPEVFPEGKKDNVNDRHGRTLAGRGR